MSVNKGKIILSLLCGLILFSSCKKDKDADDNLMLKVTALHHYHAVSNLPVYLKEGATEFPGTDVSVYRHSATTDNNGIVHFGNLSSGNYYLYATGFDYGASDTVHGQKAVVLSSSSSGSGLIDVTLYVTE
jgi:hypothetical protein